MKARLIFFLSFYFWMFFKILNSGSQLINYIFWFISYPLQLISSVIVCLLASQWRHYKPKFMYKTLNNIQILIFPFFHMQLALNSIGPNFERIPREIILHFDEEIHITVEEKLQDVRWTHVYFLILKAGEFLEGFRNLF